MPLPSTRSSKPALRSASLDAGYIQPHGDLLERRFRDGHRRAESDVHHARPASAFSSSHCIHEGLLAPAPLHGKSATRARHSGRWATPCGRHGDDPSARCREERKKRERRRER
uniref:Uncharacterized protein n=1 Tax=Oryza brachyantha TaxID=4533 RepID=J3LJZ3_ORYBR